MLGDQNEKQGLEAQETTSSECLLMSIPGWVGLRDDGKSVFRRRIENGKEQLSADTSISGGENPA